MDEYEKKKHANTHARLFWYVLALWQSHQEEGVRTERQQQQQQRVEREYSQNKLEVKIVSVVVVVNTANETRANIYTERWI